MRHTFLFMLIGLFFFSGWLSAGKNAGDVQWPSLKGPFLGKKTPGEIPQIFDSGKLTGDLRLFNLSFSPDGSELFFSYYKGTEKKPEPGYEIRHMQRVHNIWQPPETAFFSGTFSDCDITFSPDGQRCFFASALRNHPVTGDDMDIYYIEKTVDGWSQPVYAGPEVNSKYGEVHACLSRKGNLFFRSNRPGGYGHDDLYKAEYIDGRFVNVQNLGPRVNTKHMETDCFVAQDESFILFNTRRPEDDNKVQIYVSFQVKKNQWTTGQPLGINSRDGTSGSTLSPDGKYLFYKSRIGNHRAVYWVSTSVIKKFKETILQ